MEESSEYTVELIPPQASELSRADALQWLEGSLPGLTVVATAGYGCEDPDDRSAFQELALDVATLTEAAAVALRQSAPVRLQLADGDAAIRTLRLARIVA